MRWKAPSFVGGAVIQWLRDGCASSRTARDSEYCGQEGGRTTAACTSCPAFAGLGAPYWDYGRPWAPIAARHTAKPRPERRLPAPHEDSHRLPERMDLLRGHGSPSGTAIADRHPEGGWREPAVNALPDAVPVRYSGRGGAGPADLYEDHRPGRGLSGRSAPLACGRAGRRSAICGAATSCLSLKWTLPSGKAGQGLAQGRAAARTGPSTRCKAETIL